MILDPENVKILVGVVDLVDYIQQGGCRVGIYI